MDYHLNPTLRIYTDVKIDFEIERRKRSNYASCDSVLLDLGFCTRDLIKSLNTLFRIFKLFL